MRIVDVDGNKLARYEVEYLAIDYVEMESDRPGLRQMLGPGQTGGSGITSGPIVAWCSRRAAQPAAA